MVRTDMDPWMRSSVQAIPLGRTYEELCVTGDKGVDVHEDQEPA